MILLIDNYDSFSYNLYQLVGAIDPDIRVIRNDELRIEEIDALHPARIILSPGPGRPEDAGILIDVVKTLSPRIPTLGVCLGHQAICAAFGATVTYAKELMHGKQSLVHFDTSSRLFQNCPKTAPVARYHSLTADAATMPDCLKVTAVTDDGEIMAVRHKDYPICGVQFHPESIMTPNGKTIEKKQIKPLEDNELCAFLKEIRGDTYELVYFVTVFTGLRQGEVLGLTWDCVNFEKHTLLINKQHGKKKGTCEYCFSSLKNDRPRLIEAADGVMDALKKQQIQQQRWAARLKDGWENSDNLVFTTETGRYLCNQTVYLAFKKVMRRLHLDATRFHDLRHTYAVNSLKSGDDIKTVQENLGHQTAAFTLDVYAHATSSMKHESANRMDQYIHNVTKP